MQILPTPILEKPISTDAEVGDAEFEGADLEDAKNMDKAKNIQDADFE